MKNDDMPIVKSLEEYKDEEVVSFHMPGHKRGSIYKRLELDYLDDDVLKLDTTEVPGIDNLHSPEAAILEAQKLAAEAFGADYSFFLVNGTTAGIYSMILAATKPGDRIIIPRNCHRSVFGAVVLGRLQPVYVEPETDPGLGIAVGIRPETVLQAMEKHKDIKAVVITYPTYYGTCSDIEAIAKIVHAGNALLLVDEAHGSHFNFNERLPKPSLKAGADMAAQSIHKTLPSMTQSSMLHVRAGRVDMDKLKFFLQLTQTTSPSHILLASLDSARHIMQEKGKELLDQTIKWSDWARGEINKIPGLYCISRDRIGSCGVADLDPTRLTVNFEAAGISGTSAELILRNDFKIQVEMSDLYNIVAIASIGNCREDYVRFVSALRKIAAEGIISPRGAKPLVSYKASPELCMMPWEAVYCEKEQLNTGKSAGRICGEMVIPYPPGIPVLMPGERITQESIEYLKLCNEHGIKLNGASDPKLDKICVLKK